jgi:hypothetical protein
VTWVELMDIKAARSYVYSSFLVITSTSFFTKTTSRVCYGSSAFLFLKLSDQPTMSPSLLSKNFSLGVYVSSSSSSSSSSSFSPKAVDEKEDEFSPPAYGSETSLQ